MEICLGTRNLGLENIEKLCKGWDNGIEVAI